VISCGSSEKIFGLSCVGGQSSAAKVRMNQSL
jgi:hypothetical protein